jgi:hypothetical protein
MTEAFDGRDRLFISSVLRRWVRSLKLKKHLFLLQQKVVPQRGASLRLSSMCFLERVYIQFAGECSLFVPLIGFE